MRLIDADELMKHKGNCYDEEGHLLYAVGTGNIMRMPTIEERKEKWIPCSVEKPKKTGYYICTCHDGVCYRTSVLKWSTGWVLTGARAYWKVIAWMPLPEPYREDGEADGDG